MIMARMTIAQLERLAGQGSGTDTYRDHEDIETSQHVVWMQPTIYSRIMDVMERGGALSRLQIAQALGLKKTPWLVDRIERLAADGYIAKLESRTPQGVVMWIYEVRK
jgi:hypothetical protein